MSGALGSTYKDSSGRTIKIVAKKTGSGVQLDSSYGSVRATTRVMSGQALSSKDQANLDKFGSNVSGTQAGQMATGSQVFYNPITKTMSTLNTGFTSQSNYEQQKAVGFAQKETSLRSNNSYGVTFDYNNEVDNTMPKTNSLRSSISSSISSIYGKVDNLLHGFLPGGINRTEYKTNALKTKTPIMSSYLTAKDEYETMKQQAKIQDQYTDAQYKLEKERLELEKEKEMANLKAMQDLYKKSWYENLGIARSQEEKIVQDLINRGQYYEAVNNSDFFRSSGANITSGNQLANDLLTQQNSNSISGSIQSGLKWGIPIVLGLVAFNLSKKNK